MILEQNNDNLLKRSTDYKVNGVKIEISYYYYYYYNRSMAPWTVSGWP